jgi:OHCU decarboxylase
MDQQNKTFSIYTFNTANDTNATNMILPLIERSPNTAKLVAKQRPFSTALMLAEALTRNIYSLNEESCIELFLGHPELAAPNPEQMTEESQLEQGRLQLSNLQHTTQTKLDALNDSYNAKFGFPFIIALYRYKKIDDVLTEFERRLNETREIEIRNALTEICSISISRLNEACY